MEHTSALKRAIGTRNQVEFAELIGATQQLVSYWIKQDRVSPAFTLAVEAKTGVSRHELRPDIFGPAPDVLPTRTASAA